MLGRVLQAAVVGTLLVAAVTGGWLVAGGPVQGTAAGPLTLDAGTAAEHGFEEPTVETVDFEERLAVAGVEKDVDVSAYVMNTANPEAETVVMTLSLPGWTVAGVSLNPLTHAPLKQTVTHVFPYLPMDTPEVAWTGETTVQIGGEEATAGEYTVGDDTRFVVARTTVGGDTVFAIGVYPAANPDARAAVDAVFGELTHA